MRKYTKQERQLLQLKRLLFLDDLRDSLNQIPEDISCIYRLEKKTGGEDRICAREENGWHMMTRLGSVFHRNQTGEQGEEARYNRKFVKPDPYGGSSEAVICFPPGKEPYLVRDPVNCGTYNFISPIRAAFPLVTFRTLTGHFAKDVLPYFRQNRLKDRLEALRLEEEQQIQTQIHPEIRPAAALQETEILSGIRKKTGRQGRKGHPHRQKRKRKK